ncbi:relaxase/mobilization nuclease domain-containing protein [Dyadobacter sp. CY107]|uniref:relaxase/mobilization nuclease domain-containing protein n=1 Tax=Dyadobacter fanqingshengii TaxID=2906443 RepID=UPI001F3E7D68|nr:relaxase/mobilization nuclease domain-containing protein [Dyadobacter fanqingshengii]MCF2502193.1 relaxase/mobilization nuclease domain-containing protein [Dyadobacter fanqingshengii]
MVAIIKTGASIRSTFYYNENKLKEGVAECIMGGNYPDDVANLNEQERLNMLLKLAALNTNVVRNSVHISLNFDPSEQHSKALLKEISLTYMEKIGFGDQPFLVYQHHDAGHPHIHIVSVKVAHDGSRIETQNIGRNQSERARKEIEQEFHLVKASGKKQQQSEHLKPAMVNANYGKVETKRAISNILAGVIDKYKYTSIPELNAVLNRYNVAADRGSEESRTFKKGGLHYRLLNAKGERVGVPIKASDFHQKPTLNYLQNRFEINDQLRQSDKLRIKNAIDFTLYGKTNVTLDRLINILERDGIDTVLRKNDTGLIYGITYVDHRSKAVFNGSSLGKNYSAKAIQERCVAIDTAMHNRLSNTQKQEHLTTGHGQSPTSKSYLLATPQQSNDARLANGEDSLFDPVKQDGFTPTELRGNKRKKKKGFSQSL